MANHYALIDEQNRCCGFAESSNEIVADDYILIEKTGSVNMWDVWNGETWEEGTPPEPETPEPTQLDRIENNLALLTEDTAEYKAFYEAAKEILPEGSDA